MSHHQLLFTSVSAGGGVKITNFTAQRTSVDPADAYAGVKFNNASPYAEQRAQGTTLTWTNIDSWLLSGTPSDYEFRALVTTGPSTPTGSMNLWINASLLTGPNWYLAQTTVGSKGCVLSVEARNASTLAIVATGSFILRAIVDI